MNRATSGGVLAAVVLLSAVVIVQATRPAEAGGIAARGDPCPADIDDNGTVNVQDFLILLGSWGPCPGPPRLVATDSSGAVGPGVNVSVRLWSDNTLDLNVLGLAIPCWLCGNSYPPPGEWIVVEPPLLRPSAQPIDVALSGPIHGAGTGATQAVWVSYSDGTMYWRLLDMAHDGPVCDNDPDIVACNLFWVTPWTALAP